MALKVWIISILIIGFYCQCFNINASKVQDSATLNCNGHLSFCNTTLNTLRNTTESFNKSNKLAFRATENQCSPKVSLYNCNTEFSHDTKWIWRRDTFYTIYSKVNKSCKNSKISYTWIIETNNLKKTLSSFQDKKVFHLKYYSLDTGEHILHLKIQETANGKLEGTDYAKCLIKIRPEVPISIIEGGQLRMVPSGIGFLIQGNTSANMDYPPGVLAPLYMTWTCESKPDTTLCERFDHFVVTYIIVSQELAVANTDFNFTLQVATPQSDGILTEQIVKVRSGAKDVYITCMKNCQLSSNPMMILYLRANCNNCPDEDYEWSMIPDSNNEKKELNFDSETHYGKNSAKLIIKENVLIAGDNYTFLVSYKGGIGESSKEIKMALFPIKGVCDIRPKEGNSLSTEFNITCQDFIHTDTLIYHFFAKSPEPGTSNDGTFSSYLPAEKSGTLNLIVKASDANNMYVEETLQISILSEISSLPIDKQLQRCIDEYKGKNSIRDSVESLISSGDTDKALQVINVLIAEELDVSKSAPNYAKSHLTWKKIIAKDLIKFPMETFEEIQKVAATIKRLSWPDKDNIESELGSFVTEVCSKASKALFNNIRQRGIERTVETTEISQNLKWCSEINMEANPSDLIIEKDIFSITTGFPLISLPVIPEDYSNYDDADIEYVKKLRNYKAITKNSLEATTFAGLGIAETLASGEPSRQIGTKGTSYIISDMARTLARKKIGTPDCFVRGSKDLAKLNEATTKVVVTLYEDNPYWWTTKAYNLSMGVLDVNYYVDDIKLKYLGGPIEMNCKIKSFDKTFVQSAVTVSVNLSEWIPEKLDYNITVHKIDVKKSSGMFVFFSNLENQKLQVVLDYNRRPHTEDFKNPIIIEKEGNIIKSMFPRKESKYGDAWLYLGVLPDKSMLDSTNENVLTVNYSVAFVSPLCVYWKEESEQWESLGCRTGTKTSLTDIQCFCQHRSAYSGVYLNAKNKIDKLLKIQFYLTLQSNYLIFKFVCIVLGLYCIGLCLAGTRRVGGTLEANEVHFLSDNLEHERYAYVVTVKTGSVNSAGTTSNISLKIVGSKCHSTPHILNYPDPCKKLLQKGAEDNFILTTEKYLGDVERIYLWFDSIGFRPEWFCEWIRVSDLQSENEWYFQVNKWLSVLKNESTFLLLKPLKDPPDINWRHSWIQLILKSMKNEHNWNILNFKEDRLSYIKRITMILSIVLTTFVLSLIMYGFPRMRLFDGLSPYGHYELYPFTILVACGSSLISFTIHLIIIKCFNKSFNEKCNKKFILNAVDKAWALLITLILSMLTVLIVFGFWLAYVTSLLWISSIIGSLIQSLLLLENIHAIIKLLLKQKNSKRETLDSAHVLKMCEEQRLTFYSRLGSSLLRPYLSSKYLPLSREDYKVKQEEELNKLRIAELIQDIIMFLIYIVLLYAVVLANKDELNIYSQLEIESLLIGKHTRTTQFDEIENIEGFYEYINNTLFPNIHSSNWYSTWEMKDAGIMADFNIKVIGVARLRQLRVYNNSCKIPNAMKIDNLSCSPEYSYRINNKGQYMEHWMPKEDVLVPRLINAWNYESNARASIGEITIYSGGGYSVPLGRTLYNSYYNLKYLIDSEWIDYNSRVIFVEFLAYNPNYNIFHSVKLLLERSASGLHLKSHSIDTTRLLFVKSELQIMTILTFLIFIGIVLLMALKHFCSAVKGFNIFIKDRWNIVDIIIIAMSFTCVCLYVHRSNLVGDFLRQIESSRHNQFINYSHLIYMDEMLTMVAAILICTATIRLWKLLRFGKIFKIMENTIALSSILLTAIIICHLIIVLMYSYYGYILFGADNFNFKDFISSFSTLILLSMGLCPNFNVEFIEGTWLGYMYYTSYMLLTMTITTLYVAVIVASYEESCIHYSKLIQSYTVQKYVKNESIYIKELIVKRWRFERLSGGSENILNGPELKRKVTPKSDEHRYADCMMFSAHKRNIMFSIANAVILNLRKTKTSKSKLSHKRLNLMQIIISGMLGANDLDDADEVYFVGVEDGKTVFVSDARILLMESAVNTILNKGTEKNLQRERFGEAEDQVGLLKNQFVNQLEQFEVTLKSILRVIDNITVSCENKK